MQKWMERLYSTEEGKRLLEQERVLLEAQEAVCELMKEAGITRSELARRMGVTSAYITKLLRSGHNFTLRTLADIFYCLGRAGHVEHGPIEAAISCPYSSELPPSLGCWEIPGDTAPVELTEGAGAVLAGSYDHGYDLAA